MEPSYSTSVPETPREISQTRTPVRQVTVMVPNAVGTLLQLAKSLHEHQVEILGISLQDTVEATQVRMILSDVSAGEKALASLGYSAILHEVIVIELQEVSRGFCKALSALLEAELNLQHCYSLMIHDSVMGFLVLVLDDLQIGIECLTKAGFKVLSQDELSR